jgi:hypothetical protein
MEKKNIKVIYGTKEYDIDLQRNEYIIDEPAGGGCSVTYRIANGIPFEALRDVEMFKIDPRMVKKLKNVVVYEYEWHYLWEPGFKDMFYYALVKDDNGNIKEIHFSELEGEKELLPKF